MRLSRDASCRCPVPGVACMAWPLRKTDLGAPDKALFHLRPETVGSDMPWLVVLRKDDYDVVPTKVASPLAQTQQRCRRWPGPCIGIAAGPDPAVASPLGPDPTVHKCNNKQTKTHTST